MNIFNQLIKEIESEYTKSNNNLGWRFLSTSKATLEKNSGIFLVTLNPGGRKIIPGHGVASCEDGCAYITESWKGKSTGTSLLQQQFRLLFKELATHLDYDDHIKLMESSVCGHFIPFRSPDYQSLKNKKQAVDLGKRIWSKIFSFNIPTVAICIDKKTYKYFSELLLIVGCSIIESVELPIGWGKYNATVAKYKNSGDITTLIRFPHLSGFAIFGREKSTKNIKVIFNKIFCNKNKIIWR